MNSIKIYYASVQIHGENIKLKLYLTVEKRNTTFLYIKLQSCTDFMHRIDSQLKENYIRPLPTYELQKHFKAVRL